VHRSGGRLRIGIFAHGAGALALPVLQAFEAELPDVEVDVSDVSPVTLVTALLDGRIDVVLATGEIEDERLDVRAFATSSVALVTRAGERDPIVAAFRAVAERVTADQLHRVPGAQAPATMAAAA
jgi:DNA-binding transcriptional LysR family regulator